VAVSADVSWSNRGTISAGGTSVFNYGFVGGQSYSSVQFTPRAPTDGRGSGEGAVTMYFDVGPRVSLYYGGVFGIGAKYLFDSKFSIRPWVRLGGSYSLPAFPAKIAPFANETIFFDQKFGSACTSVHYVEWDLNCGAQVLFNTKKTSFFGAFNATILDYRVPKPLAKGCLLTQANVLAAYKKIVFFFDQKIKSLKLSDQSFGALLLQDLSSSMNTPIEGSVTIYNDQNGRVQATLTLPDYSDQNQAAVLQNAARNPASIYNGEQRTTLSSYALPAPNSSTKMAPLAIIIIALLVMLM